jgi:acetyltransferase-like isoleucine patch superfamily enzyme
VGPRVTIHGTSYRHNRLDIPIRIQEVTSKGVKIENNVWIGSGTVVLDGSEIGEGVIVAPGSVVASKHLPIRPARESSNARVSATLGPTQQKGYVAVS